MTLTQAKAILACLLIATSAQGEVTPDSAKKFEQHLNDARNGSSRAQFEVATDYFFGIGVEVDQVKAVEWFQKTDYPAASFFLGECYYFGLGGLKKDLRSAYVAYLFATRTRSEDHFYLAREACYAVACAHEKGEGIQADPVAALNWFKAAAKDGHREAQFKVAIRLKDAELLRKAAEQDHPAAQMQLGLILNGGGWGIPQNIEEAAAWFRKSADQGNPVSQSQLGMFYRNGRGVQKDLQQSALWFKKAADQGSSWSQHQIGSCLRLGEGVPKDEIEAYAYLNLAGASIEQARNELAEMEKTMSSDARMLGQLRTKQLSKQIEGRVESTEDLRKAIERENLRKGA
jgi:TPR repeat protein